MAISFLQFISNCPKRIEYDFKGDIKVIKNDLTDSELATVFEVSDEIDNMDLLNAMAAGMKQTYPLNFNFHETGFSVSDNKQIRIADVIIETQDEDLTHREATVTVSLTPAGKKHSWTTNIIPGSQN